MVSSEWPFEELFKAAYRSSRKFLEISFEGGVFPRIDGHQSLSSLSFTPALGDARDIRHTPPGIDLDARGPLGETNYMPPPASDTEEQLGKVPRQDPLRDALESFRWGMSIRRAHTSRAHTQPVAHGDSSIHSNGHKRTQSDRGAG
jgi:hypothetical protein